jgi:hypothetical protein
MRWKPLCSPTACRVEDSGCHSAFPCPRLPLRGSGKLFHCSSRVKLEHLKSRFWDSAKRRWGAILPLSCSRLTGYFDVSLSPWGFPPVHLWPILPVSISGGHGDHGGISGEFRRGSKGSSSWQRPYVTARVYLSQTLAPAYIHIL